jgi:hypothetical protein
MANQDFIHKGQTKLKLEAETGIDVTSATTVQIKYKKPSAATIYTLTATKDGSDNSKIYYNLSTDLLTETGLWTFWSYVTFADGTVAAGAPFQKYINKEGG